MKNSVVPSIKLKQRLLSLEDPIVMGIINCTPDSFHAGSRHQTLEAMREVITRMTNEGAKILDFGGQSTRPGARQVGVQEEMDRVLPAIELAHRLFPNIICSIDTFYGAVATAAMEAGAEIINDISAGSIDASIWEVAQKTQAPYVLMHMQGTPQDMQASPTYKDVTKDVFMFFQEKLQQLKHFGIEEVIIDLGFGFGKALTHNYTLLRNMEIFESLQKPILTGISRKSMIYKPLNTNSEQALNGTSILHAWALERGSKILRVHDVKEAREAIQLWKLMQAH